MLQKTINDAGNGCMGCGCLLILLGLLLPLGVAIIGILVAAAG